MIPKLEEGFKLLEGSLDSFHIVNTETPDRLIKEIENAGTEGTAILK
jgi:acetylglutamate kinase